MECLNALLGDPVTFYKRRCDWLFDLGIDVADLDVSHLAFRTKTYRTYLDTRERLETHAKANMENVWNGRPISKILLKERLQLSAGAFVDLVELIPPFHQCVYPMGLEHIGFVVGDGVVEFGQRHRAVLTGQQFQSEVCMPYFVRFPDYSHAKFYRYSLMDVCKLEGRIFDGFLHAQWESGDPDAGPYPNLLDEN